MASTRNGVRLGFALILTLVPGCDNVDWGGADFAVVEPPPKGQATVAVADSNGLSPLPTGPILYYVRTTSGGGMLVPVAEIAGDTLRRIDPGADPGEYANRFIGEMLRQGSEFTLFTQGMRAGTFVVESARPSGEEACPQLPVAAGALELIARIDPDSVREFLAMAKRQAPEPTRLPVDLVPGRRIQVLGPILAERLLRARSSQLPGNWQAAMKQSYPFPVPGAAVPGFTGTLLVGDELGIGRDSLGFSLFFVALPNAQAGYDTVYARYTNYEREPKRSARTIDFLDWDRDGKVELLQEVYGPRWAWFGAVGEVDDQWRSIYDGSCDMGGIPSHVPASEAPPDTIAGSPEATAAEEAPPR